MPIRTAVSANGVSNMDSTPSETTKSTSLTISLRDATAADLDPEQMAVHEGAYRRGVHQALAFAGDIADRAATLKECNGSCVARRIWPDACDSSARMRVA